MADNFGKYSLITCENCKALVPAGNVCKECGKPMFMFTAGVLPKVKCPFCREDVAKGNFCSKCGSVIKGVLT